MKADLHHLFTAQMECNSFRNNYPYGKYSKVNNYMSRSSDVLVTFLQPRAGEKSREHHLIGSYHRELISVHCGSHYSIRW